MLNSTSIYFKVLLWGYSSVGRAPALQAGGQEFESPYLHHTDTLKSSEAKIEAMEVVCKEFPRDRPKGRVDWLEFDYHQDFRDSEKL